MSTPVNSLNNLQARTNVFSEPLNLAAIKADAFGHFSQLDKFDFADRIRVITPKVTTPQTETYGMHDAHEQPTGENVSFDASDPASLYSAFEKLADSPSTQDKIKAQELLLKFQELMQLQIQKASVLHDIASSAIKALRG